MYIAFLIGTLLLLTACESVKSTLGMDHYQADEFNVQQHPPLSLPPNYKLMPPRKKDKDGKSVPLNSSAKKAKQVVGGGKSESSLSESSQQDLKDKAGTADDSIREQVDGESTEAGDSALDNKLNAWKKEFVRNAKSIKGTDNNRPVEKLKEELAHEPSGEHQESLKSKVESELEHKAVTEGAEKNLTNANKVEEIKNN